MTTQVVPRWEWRVFDMLPSAAIAEVTSRAPNEEVSPETYVLAASSPHNVKIRDRTLELKELVDEAWGGFELWKPVLSLPFPVTPSALTPLWRLFGIPAVRCSRPSYTQRDFVTELLPAAGLAAVYLTKRRTRFQIAGCAAERASIAIGMEQWESLAIEDANLERLRAARAHLAGYALSPSNYPAWLKQVAGVTTSHSVVHGNFL